MQVGNNTIASYEYNEYNGKLNKLTYANGLVEEYVYNTLEMLEEVWYTTSDGRVLACSYEYTSNGELPDYCRDLDNYEFVRGAESSCYVYKITEDSINSYALSMYIMGSHIKDGSYTLFLVFDSKFSDLDFYEKIQKSYRFAGIIEEEIFFQ